jgi:hypothetical protein
MKKGGANDLITTVQPLRTVYRGNMSEKCHVWFNPLTPELKPSAQRSLTRIFYWGFFFLNSAFR